MTSYSSPASPMAPDPLALLPDPVEQPKMRPEGVPTMLVMDRPSPVGIFRSRMYSWKDALPDFDDEAGMYDRPMRCRARGVEMARRWVIESMKMPMRRKSCEHDASDRGRASDGHTWFWADESYANDDVLNLFERSEAGAETQSREYQQQVQCMKAVAPAYPSW